MSKKGIGVIDINKLAGLDKKSVTCVEGGTVIYSERDDDNHWEKVGILMSQKLEVWWNAHAPTGDVIKQAKESYSWSSKMYKMM